MQVDKKWSQEHDHHQITLLIHPQPSPQRSCWKYSINIMSWWVSSGPRYRGNLNFETTTWEHQNRWRRDLSQFSRGYCHVSNTVIDGQPSALWVNTPGKLRLRTVTMTPQTTLSSLCWFCQHSVCLGFRVTGGQRRRHRRRSSPVQWLASAPLLPLLPILPPRPWSLLAFVHWFYFISVKAIVTAAHAGVWCSPRLSERRLTLHTL